MTVLFPSSPPTGETITDAVSGAVWQWDGVKWTHTHSVPAEGITLTGPLVLAGDPVGPLDAATKQFVDNEVAAVGGGGGLDDAPDDAAQYARRGPPTSVWQAITAGAKVTYATTAPASPTQGDIWLNSSTQLMQIWASAAWRRVGTPQFVQASQPAAGVSIEGALWFNTTTNTLWHYVSGVWRSDVTTGTGSTYVLQQGPTINQPRLMGITNGSNAAPGEVGEIVSIHGDGTVYYDPPPLSFTTTPALPAGDWDINFALTVVAQGAAIGPNGFWVDTGHGQFSFTCPIPLAQAFSTTVYFRINSSSPTTFNPSFWITETTILWRASVSIYARRAR